MERGREFAAPDDANGAGVAVLSRTAAEFYFPVQDPIGQRITLQIPEGGQVWRPIFRKDSLTIVGIAGDVREWQWGDPKIPQLIFAGDAESLAAAESGGAHGERSRRPRRRDVIEAIQRVDPEQPVFQVKSMQDFLDEAFGMRHFELLLLGVFGAIAVGLAAVGLYGVMAFSVSQRSQEIGVRMALGAQPRDVLRMVLNEGLLLTLWGLLAGAIAAIGIMRMLRGEMFGVEIWDPVTYVSVATLLVLVASVASLIPARRATRVDPLSALRYE